MSDCSFCMLTVSAEVVPPEAEGSGLEDLDEQNVELNSFQKHPRKRGEEEIMKKSSHSSTQLLQEKHLETRCNISSNGQAYIELTDELTEWKMDGLMKNGRISDERIDIQVSEQMYG